MAVYELPLNGLSDNHIGQPTGLVGPDGELLRRGVGTATRPREGYDGFAVPHALQFSSTYGSPRGYWRDKWDEALKHSREDAITMENDLGIMGMLQERQLAFVTLPWHIHVPDENDPTQAAVKAHITKTIESLVGPEESLMKLRQSLSWALWFGRQAAQAVWQWNRMSGVKTLTLADWLPTRGDKISHLKDGTPAVDIYAAATEHYEFPDSDITQTTNGARALVLNGDMSWGWRMRYILHAHELIDADFFDSQAAEAVFGVGIRSRIYYLNWVDKEWLARTCDWVDQVGLGVNLWYYDASNSAARMQAQKAAAELSDRTNILVPRWGNEKHPALERLEVNGSGAELLLRLRQDIREQMRLYINGQTMSTGGTHDGRGDMGGSHRAAFAQDTKTQVRNFDARNLDATLTGSMKCPGLVSMIQYHTFPQTWPSPSNPEGFRASFVSELEDKESKERLDAIKTVWEMGVDVKADDLRSAAGIGKPTEGDEIIAGQQAAAPGMVPGQNEQPPEPGQEQPAQQEKTEPFPQPSMNARYDYAADAGHWITIGGTKGEEGKRHGGSPVYIENGRITKGAPSLTGKKIEAMKESGEPEPQYEFVRAHTVDTPSQGVLNSAKEYQARAFKRVKELRQRIKDEPLGGNRHGLRLELMRAEDDHRQSKDMERQARDAIEKRANELGKTTIKEKAAPSRRAENQQAGDYDRARYAKQARKEGINPGDLHQLAAEMIAHNRAHVEPLKKMLQHARKVAESLGSNLDTLKARAARGIDSDAVRGLDDVAQSMAATYPEFFHDNQENPEEKLLDYLLAGNPEPMSEADAYEQALDELRRHKEEAGRFKVPDDEPVPFMRQEHYEYNPNQPRDEHGRWGEGGGAKLRKYAALTSKLPNGIARKARTFAVSTFKRFEARYGRRAAIAMMAGAAALLPVPVPGASIVGPVAAAEGIRAVYKLVKRLRASGQYSREDVAELYGFDEAQHPRDEGGQFVKGGVGADHADKTLRAKMKSLVGDKADMKGRQYLGQVKDFLPEVSGLHSKVASAHVFFDPSLRHEAAGITEGRTVAIGPAAFSGRGSSGSLGDTFLHEIEHLVDEHSGRGRQEFTPRLRQMLRELEGEKNLARFLGRHGDDQAGYHVGAFFDKHAGHELTAEEKAEATKAVVDKAKELWEAKL